MKITSMNKEMMVRYFSGELTEEEQRALLAWLNESHENERELFLMKDVYDAGNVTQLYNEAQTAEGWRKFQQQTAAGRKFPLWAKRLLRYAAILIIGILCGSLVVYYNSKPQLPTPITVLTGKYEVQTGKGERALVTLPDGSTVKLNACSYLSYTGDFGNESRLLQFSGEGYFDVQTNPEMPFVVHTSGLNIKAYGTTFNIKAYTDEDLVETTLVKGSVTIENERNQKIITMQPDQVVAIPKKLIDTNNIQQLSKISNKNISTEMVALMPKKTEQKAILVDKVEANVFASWKDNQWIVKAESLESLAKKIERKYDVLFTFLDEDSKKYTFSGTLKDYPLEQILEVIRLNAPIQYTVKEKNVTVCEVKHLRDKYKHLIRSTN